MPWEFSGSNSFHFTLPEEIEYIDSESERQRDEKGETTWILECHTNTWFWEIFSHNRQRYLAYSIFYYYKTFDKLLIKK